MQSGEGGQKMDAPMVVGIEIKKSGYGSAVICVLVINTYKKVEDLKENIETPRLLSCFHAFIPYTSISPFINPFLVSLYCTYRGKLEGVAHLIHD